MEKYALVNLGCVEQQQSTMVINGIPQGGRTVKLFVATCSSCNRLLAQFNPGESIGNVIAYCQHNLRNEFVYCPTCGCKLNYMMDILDMEEVKHEPTGTEQTTS